MEEIHRANLNKALSPIFTERGIIDIVHQYYYQEYVIIDYIGGFVSDSQIKTGSFHNTDSPIEWTIVADFKPDENSEVSYLPYNNQAYLYQFVFYDYLDGSSLKDMFIGLSGREPTQEIELVLSDTELEQQDLDLDDMGGNYTIAYLKSQHYIVISKHQRFWSKYLVWSDETKIDDSYLYWSVVLKFNPSENPEAFYLPYNNEPYLYQFVFYDYLKESPIRNLFFGLTGKYPTQPVEYGLGNGEVDFYGMQPEHMGGECLNIELS